MVQKRRRHMPTGKFRVSPEAHEDSKSISSYPVNARFKPTIPNSFIRETYREPF